jgi:hypothetical protein
MTTYSPSQGRSAEEELPYAVELWQQAPAEKIERVLARAASLKLANAILKSAEQEYPDRRLTLRNGTEIVTDATPREQARS